MIHPDDAGPQPRPSTHRIYTSAVAAFLADTHPVAAPYGVTRRHIEEFVGYRFEQGDRAGEKR